MIGVRYIGSTLPCPVCIGAGPIPVGAVITGPEDLVRELLARSDFEEVKATPAPEPTQWKHHHPGDADEE